MSTCNNENKSLAKIVSGAVCGILMLTCIIVYLVLGVTINFWHPGWLIVVCGAIGCGIIGVISDLIVNIKNYKKEKNTKEE